jgi:P-type conjugative transfer protein TrbG
MTSSNVGTIVFLSLLGACASQPAPRYFEARPVFKPPRPPAVVTVVKPVPLPGQLRPVPPPNRPKGPPPAPCLVNPDATAVLDKIESKPASPRGEKKGSRRAAAADDGCDDVAARISQANARATKNPDEDAYFNAINVQDYEEGEIFQVYGAVLRLTTISLQPGEKLMDVPAAGDATRWAVGFSRSMATIRGPKGDSQLVEQQHITVRPTRKGLDTTMLLTTNRRVYHLELHSFEPPWDNTYMVAVSWRYPQDEIADFKAADVEAERRENAVTASFDPTKAYYNYEIKPTSKTPVWTPQQVFDDGQHTTFIRFPKSVLNSEVPALYVLSSSGEIQLPNWRTKNEYYMVDGIFQGFELRLGQKKQEIVRVYRK